MDEKEFLNKLIPYLPFDLKVKRNDVILTMSLGLKGRGYVYIKHVAYHFRPISYPLLKPLSSLTDSEIQEIYNANDIDIVRMKYAIVINYQLMGDWFKDQINLRQAFEEENSHLTMPAWLYIELLKRHYDVFMLIPQGLAIDINTLQPAALPTTD